jgi:2-dehydro-3-deoxygalactonokinase
VIRGEETQVLGLLTGEPDFSGLVCLPGTHSKWIQLQAGQFRSFRTAMTGELFQVIAKHTVLHHTVTTDWMSADGTADDWAMFDRAVERALRNPAGVATSLFQSRAASLVADEQPLAASARLSGLLIGLELAAVRGWLTDTPDSAPVICGAPTLVDLYQRALSALDLTARPINAAGAVISGLARIRAVRPT